MKALEVANSEEKNLVSASVDAGSALFVKRSTEQESRMYSSLEDGRTSELAEQILAVRFEDSSEYDTKDEPEDEGKQVISAKDIELPDVEIQDQEQARKMLTEHEDMWQGQLGEVKG